jgi:Tfp pilus assembly PilM family ATPase
VTRDHAQHLVNVHGVLSPAEDARHGDAHPGDAGGPEIQSAITAAVADVVASLVEQIQRTLRFIEQQRRHQQPTSLWLMGGGASMRHIGPHLEAALQLPVTVWRMPRERERESRFHDSQAALFGPALALSALAWRAA